MRACANCSQPIRFDGGTWWRVDTRLVRCAMEFFAIPVSSDARYDRDRDTLATDSRHSREDAASVRRPCVDPAQTSFQPDSGRIPHGITTSTRVIPRVS